MEYGQECWQSCLCVHAVLAQSTGGKQLLWVAHTSVLVMDLGDVEAEGWSCNAWHESYLDDA